MSAYLPPIDNVPIFDPLLFPEVTGGGGLTLAELQGLFLEFPNAQGKEEMLAMDVNGVAQFFANVTLNDPPSPAPPAVFVSNIESTFNDNLVIGGISGTNYIEFPDGSKQYTAASGGGLIGSPTYIQATIPATSGVITPPAGAKTMQIILIAAGGEAGFDNNLNGILTPGGSGGAGAYTSVTMPAITGALQYDLYAGDSGLNLQYTPFYLDLYGPATLPNFYHVDGAAPPAGVGQSYLMAAGSQNPPVPSGSSAGIGGVSTLPSNTQGGVYVTQPGSNGKSYPAVPDSPPPVFITEPGRNYLAENSWDGDILGPWAIGSFKVYNNTGVTVVPPGPGGMALYFYS
jgi:hypothetical protein